MFPWCEGSQSILFPWGSPAFIGRAINNEGRFLAVSIHASCRLYGMCLPGSLRTVRVKYAYVNIWIFIKFTTAKSIHKHTCDYSICCCYINQKVIYCIQIRRWIPQRWDVQIHLDTLYIKVSQGGYWIDLHSPETIFSVCTCVF